MMKKSLLLIAALLLTACADKNQYQEAVQAQMEKEKDLKDYNISPEYMADCVVELSSQNMPGFFDLDPERMTAYRNYVKMLTMMKAEDPKKAMEELRGDFGSPKALADAHANYTESVLECYTAVVSKSEGEAIEKEADKPDADNPDGEKLEGDKLNEDSEAGQADEAAPEMTDGQGELEDSQGMDVEGEEVVEEAKPQAPAPK